MRTVAEHRGYPIAETSCTTAVRVGDSEEQRPVYVVPGLKDRLSSPFLTSVEEARRYIDEELDARELAQGAEEFEAVLKVRGAASVGITVPADVARRMGLDVGERVVVRIRRARRGRGEKGPRKVLRPCRMKRRAGPATRPAGLGTGRMALGDL